MGLYIDMEFRRGVLFVRLDGELDHHTADKLREKVAPILDEYGIAKLVFNMKHLRFMDSSGLGVILGRYNQIKNQNGEVVVCNLSKYLEQLFEMSGLFKIIKQARSESSALELLEVRYD